MPYDEIPYQDGSAIYPIAYHPGAPLTSDMTSKAKRTLYYLDRNKSRLMFQQTWPFNGQVPSVYVGLSDFVTIPSSFTYIAEGDAYVGAGANRIAAWVLWGGQAISEAEVAHRITAYNGTATEVGLAEAETMGASAVTNFTETWGGQLRPDVGPSGQGHTYLTYCEVDLNGMALDRDVTVHLEVQIDAKFSASYRPIFVSCFWFCEG